MDSVEDERALGLLEFWLGAGPARWFQSDHGFDGACRGFVPLWEARAEFGSWQRTAAGSLALILLLDQIPRNAFRGSARAFESDASALAAAEAAVGLGHDRAYGVPVRAFFYLPFEHAEDLGAQERSLDLFRPLGDQDALYWALVHHDAIRRFGRFPHRNALLGRESTAEERHYLETGGFGG